NPQLFLDLTTQAIKRTLYDLMIDGIKYQKIGGAEYEMALFEAQELEVYLNDFSFKVTDSSKTIYEEFVPLDSGVESKFAQDCESSDQSSSISNFRIGLKSQHQLEITILIGLWYLKTIRKSILLLRLRTQEHLRLIYRN